MHLHRILSSVILALAASHAAAQSYLPTQGQVVIADGDAVASVPGAVINTNGLDTPAMGLNGDMVVRAQMLSGSGGVSTANNRLLLYGRSVDDMVVVARGGDPEPTGLFPGAILGTATTSGIGSGIRISPIGGIMLWGSSLSGGPIIATGTGATGRNDSALFWGPVGGQAILAQRGQLTPGGGGSFLNTAFTSISNQPSCMNASGTTVFQAALEAGDVVGTTNNAAWLVGTPGALQIMLRKGDTFTVPGGDAVIGSLGFGVQMNELGMVLHDEKFSTTLGTAPATTATDGLLMLYIPGTGNLIVAREGDAAPGTVGATYGSLTIGTMALSRSGKMCFNASLVGGDVVGTTNDAAIYVGDTTGFTMAVRKGDAAPSGVTGETFATLYTSSINVNDNGAVMFYAILAGATVTTDNDAGLWVGTPGNLSIIAREGDVAPGIANAVFTTITPGSAHLNDRGQSVFGCSILLNGTTSQSATYAYDPNQGLILLNTAGDTYTTSTGPKTANGIDGGIQFNSGDGCAMTLNNNGDFVRRINFTAGSAVVRGHIGGMQAAPASLSSAGGTQSWELSAGVANAGRLYVIAGTLSGTRPGFTFGGANVPLNQDFWFPLSLQAANGPVYTNSWGLLDGNGHASASFNFPAGFGWMQGALFHHAFLVLDIATVLPTFVSEPTSVRLY